MDQRPDPHACQWLGPCFSVNLHTFCGRKGSHGLRPNSSRVLKSQVLLHKYNTFISIKLLLVVPKSPISSFHARL